MGILAAETAAVVLECLSKPVVPEVEADQGAAELKEREMDVGPPLIADAQASEAAQPREVALNDPATLPLNRISAWGV